MMPGPPRIDPLRVGPAPGGQGVADHRRKRVAPLFPILQMLACPGIMIQDLRALFVTIPFPS